MNWHIITGEYPPQPGGVSDYTYLLAKGLAEAGDHVHVWTWGNQGLPPQERVEVHVLPGHGGLHWLMRLDRGLRRYPGPHTILVQYVPHMYGWKAMNIAFCCWLALQRRKNVWVMFHEVAYPFKPGQPWKHDLLALVHRIMAWGILRSAKQSFTSTEQYLTLLRRLAPRKKTITLMRLFSNVPFDVSSGNGHKASCQVVTNHRHLLGVFSSFGRETCELLELVLPGLLENPKVGVLLIGPGSAFVDDFCRRFPMCEGRLRATGRVNALQAGSYFQACEALVQLYPDGACAARGTFLAAIASGVPVVTTPGPLTDRVFKETGAVAFAENDPEAIRRMVESLLADQASARKLGALGRQVYEQHFDLPNTIATLRRGAETTHDRRQSHNS